MKVSCVLFLILSLPVILFAQNGDTRMSALGLIGESNGLFSNNSNPTISTTGLQYDKWNKKHFGHRIILGYGRYDLTPGILTHNIVQDTVTGRADNTRINLIIVGGALEGERQFYRRLYFFCGIEARVGYGSGSTDTTFTKEYNAPQLNPYTGQMVQGIGTSSYDKTGSTASMLYVGVTPFFGLKLEFKRLSIGTQLMNYVTFRSTHHNSETEGDLDFSTNNITQRFFVLYKF